MLERLVATLPSLAIQAQAYEDLDTLADLVNRKIPLLLLDSRERWPLVDLESGANAKTDLADGNDQFDPMEPPEWAKNKFGEMAMDTSASAAAWADWTEKRLRQHYKLLLKSGHREWWNSSTLSFLRGVRDFQESTSKRNIKAIQKTQTLHAAIEYGVSGGWSNSFSSGMVEDDELETKLVEMYYDIEKDFFPQVKKQALKKFRQELKKKKARIKEENKELYDGEQQNRLSITERQEMKFAKKLLKDPKAMNAKEMTTEQWLATYDILTSKTCYAESIFDLDGIALIMSDIAKIDHLPDYHSPEALALLRRAWCDIDAYHAYADEYKWYAKMTYGCMLVLGLSIATSAAYFSRFRAPPQPNCICDAETRAEVNEASHIQDDADKLASQVTIGLSLLSSVVAGISTFTNPGSRWQHLRSSALGLESEIWSFRTRTGKYREGMNAQGRAAETVFHEKVNDIGESTLSSGDLRRTEFYAQSESGSGSSSGFLKHNQFVPVAQHVAEKSFCFDCSNLLWRNIKQIIARCCCCCKSTSSKLSGLKLETTEELDHLTYDQLLELAEDTTDTPTEAGTNLLKSLENERDKYEELFSRRKKEREKENRNKERRAKREEEKERRHANRRKYGNDSDSSSPSSSSSEEEEEKQEEEETNKKKRESKEEEKIRTRCNGKHKLMKLKQFGNSRCDDCGENVQGLLCYSCRGCNEDYCDTCFKGRKRDLISWNGTYTASSGNSAAKAVSERHDADLFVKRLKFEPRVEISEADVWDTSVTRGVKLQTGVKQPVGVCLWSGVKQPGGILTDLDLSGVQFNKKAGLYLSQVLKAPNNCITHLNLSDTIGLIPTRELDDVCTFFKTTRLFTAFPEHQKVTHLYVQKLDEEVIKWTLKSLTHTENKQNIWQMLLTSENSKIQHLDLSFNPMLTTRYHDTSLLESICSGLTQETCSITSIDLSNCHIGDSDVTYIVDVMKHSSNKITSLNLEGNNILEQGTGELIRGLTHMSCRITEFNFSIPPNQTTEIQNKIAEHMKDVLSHSLCTDVDSNIDLSKLSIKLKIFRHPRNVSKVHKLECPRDHQLARYECRETEIECNVCNKQIPTMLSIFGCYICGWDVCTLCKTKMVMKRHVECEKLRNECEKLNISRYHIRRQEDQLKRLKYTDYSKQLTSMQNAIKLHHLKKEAKAKGVTKKDVLQTLGFNTDTDRARDKVRPGGGRDKNEKKRKEENDQKRKDSLVNITNWSRTIAIQVSALHMYFFFILS